MVREQCDTVDRMGCIVRECGKPIRNHSRQLCSTHYQRWKDHGDAWYVSPHCPKDYTIEQKLEFFGWDMIDDCWIWRGRVNTDGYGVFKHHQKILRAHHESLKLKEARPSRKHNALHTCDTPRCINPDHLWWGTQRENIADMQAKGRGRRGSRWTEEQILSAVSMYRTGQYTQAQVEAHFGMASGTVCRIMSGKIWSRLTNIG